MLETTYKYCVHDYYFHHYVLLLCGRALRQQKCLFKHIVIHHEAATRAVFAERRTDLREMYDE